MIYYIIDWGGSPKICTTTVAAVSVEFLHPLEQLAREA